MSFVPLFHLCAVETQHPLGPGRQLVTGPAEAWRPPSAAPSAQTVTQDAPPHVASWGARIPNPRRGHQTWGSQVEAFRGAGGGRLSTRKGSFRNGVEGSYLKKNLKHSPFRSMEKNEFNVCWSDKWSRTGGWGSETQAPPWQLSWLASCRGQADSINSSAGLFRVQ